LTEDITLSKKIQSEEERREREREGREMN